MASDWKNQLYFGDNLKILSECIPDESVDLVYLDPPFNSNATYNVLFKEKSGERSTAQITAFEDTWHWGPESEGTYFDVTTKGGKVAELLAALRTFLGQSDMMAYLVMMAPRLQELHRVLKPTGSLYLHCDPTASHYLKILMDAIFGGERFRNEVIWRRSDPKAHAYNRFPSTHDTLLFYGKNSEAIWNPQYRPHDASYIRSHYCNVEPGTGRHYTLGDCTNPNPDRPNLTYEWKGIVKVWRWTKEKMQRYHDEGRLVYTKSGAPRYKRYLDETQGTPITTIWDDIPFINSQAQERLGYPTQKPESLLERIIKANSNEGDLVLDPFCGCGTAISVAERLNRRWTGIDVTHLAIALIRHRLDFQFHGELCPYEVKGDPKDLESARALATLDRYQFEWWTLGLVAARPAQDKKKGADKGIDGHIFFFADATGVPKKAVVQVKSGHVNRSQIGDLNNARIREKAEIALFITLEEPSQPMLKEAAAAGIYVPEYFPAMKVPRVQIFTIAELLNGARPSVPAMAPPETLRKPPRTQKIPAAEQIKMFGQRA